MTVRRSKWIFSLKAFFSFCAIRKKFVASTLARVHSPPNQVRSCLTSSDRNDTVPSGLPLDDAFCSPLPPEMEGEEDMDAFQLSDLDYSVTEGPTQRMCLAGGEEEGRRQIE